MDNLAQIAKALMADFKGILATDATEGTINKRFAKAGIRVTPEIRRKFRELLITTPNLSKFISGVILNDEIIRQRAKGLVFSELVKKNGMIPGIKVDKGTHEFANFSGEKVTEGLDGLRDRFRQYKDMGAKFAKWRAVYTVSDKTPTDTCISSNAESMARYAALAQESGLVPIVEPEVLLEGKHSFEDSERVNKKVLEVIFKFLEAHKVFLEGIILKTSFVHPGLDRSEKPMDEDVARATFRVLKSSVPTTVAGVVFLSGGETPFDATAHLSALNQKENLYWPIGFSFERALEGAAMEIWLAKEENVEKAQEVLYERAKLNWLARQGKYFSEMEG